MQPVKYHRLAEKELVEAAKFYETRRHFLGDGLLDVVEEAVANIQSHPDWGAPGRFHTRTWKVRRFPFRLVYLEEPERIWIVAVAHLSRKPAYWLERLN
ncbi:MAG: type II toxin-antitoxin system RelE/ParE family toxin [Limisphaerales bacterium]